MVFAAVARASHRLLPPISDLQNNVNLAVPVSIAAMD